MLRLIDALAILIVILMIVVTYNSLKPHNQQKYPAPSSQKVSVQDYKQIPNYASTEDEYCDRLGNLASLFMHARQQNYPIEKVKEAYAGSNNMREMADFLLEEAYGYPVVEDKESIVKKYGEVVKQSCINIVKGKSVDIGFANVSY